MLQPFKPQSENTKNKKIKFNCTTQQQTKNKTKV